MFKYFLSLRSLGPWWYSFVMLHKLKVIKGRATQGMKVIASIFYFFFVHLSALSVSNQPAAEILLRIFLLINMQKLLLIGSSNDLFLFRSWAISNQIWIHNFSNVIDLPQSLLLWDLRSIETLPHRLASDSKDRSKEMCGELPSDIPTHK